MTEAILVDLPDVVETPRLMLRPPCAGDGIALHEAITESLVELRRFLASLPWVAAEQTQESAEVFCRNAQANFLSRKDLPFLMFNKASGQLVGVVGLHRTVWGTPKTELGYWCRTSQCRNGFVAEAVSALVAYAIEHMRVVRIEIVTDEENVASRRVAERCLFSLEGILHSERRAPDGTLRNTCVYACLPNAA